MRRKIYGQSRSMACAFCGKNSTCKNSEGLPTCRHHKGNAITLRCLCKEYFDIKESKYGTYFLCSQCGPISYNKGLDMNNLPLQGVDSL